MRNFNYSTGREGEEGGERGKKKEGGGRRKEEEGKREGTAHPCVEICDVNCCIWKYFPFAFFFFFVVCVTQFVYILWPYRVGVGGRVGVAHFDIQLMAFN